MWERVAAAKALLELGADLGATGENGATAMAMAEGMFGNIMPAYEHSMITALKSFLAEHSESAAPIKAPAKSPVAP